MEVTLRNSKPSSCRTITQGGRIVDSGSGYCSQSVLPVHFGMPKEGRVDVEVTALTKAGRRVTRVANVDPNQLPRRVLLVKLPKG